VTLNLAVIGRQIEDLAAAAPWQDQGAGYDLALTLLTTSPLAPLQARVAGARTSWLVAWPHEELAARWPCPALPAAWSVLAADGSSIVPDRHSPVHYFLLNLGRVVLTYGPEPAARIDQTAHLAFRPEETHLTVGEGVRRLPIDGARLAALRTVRELEALADLAEQAAGPAVALQDGSLILWSLMSEEEAVRRWLLGAFLAAADRLRRAGVPLAAYVSLPAGTDVVNALRVAYCPHVPAELPAVNCDRCPSRHDPAGPACFAIPSIADRWLYEHRLAPGERSGLFGSSSLVLDEYRRHDFAHDVVFFYLHTGQEIARVELPHWVAAEPDLLDRVHAAIVDQTRRGQGYPTALQEAHEAAVIHADERRLVERLIDEAMARAGLTMRRSAKDTSKRVRAL
jgi:hypothetical protein